MKSTIQIFTSTIIFLAITFQLNAQIAINSDGSNPDASSMLEISSTNKGILIPRMTTVQRDLISSPATGLLIFDTDENGFMFYNGTVWTALSSTSTSLLDADNDTKIQVEESADEDIIRFDVGGKEAMTIQKNGENMPRLELLDDDFNVLIGKGTGSNLVNSATNMFSLGKNVFLGDSSGVNNTSGMENSFIGYKSGYSNTTGKGGVFIGTEAGENNTTGNYNIFIGDETGKRNTTGKENTFVGAYAGEYNTTGSYNVFLGLDAGYSNTTGNENVFIGNEVGVNSTTGERNTFVGIFSGIRNTTGYGNSFFGFLAGKHNTTGYENVYIGDSAGFHNITGHSNLFLGNYAGLNELGSNKFYLANSDADSTGVLMYGEFDKKRLRVNATLNINGAYNLPTTDGAASQFLQTDGAGNLAWNSLTNLQDADADTKIQVEESADEDIIRFDIGGNEVLNLDATATGYPRLSFQNNSNNLLFGQFAGENANAYSTHNIFIGDSTGYNHINNDNNIFIGNSAGLSSTAGYANIAIGTEAGYSIGSGFNNVFLGKEAGRSSTNGSESVFIGAEAGYSTIASNKNTFLGTSAGYSNAYGASNVFVGYKAGYSNKNTGNNTIVGVEAGYSTITGSSNVILGYQAGYNNTNGFNNVFIGAQAGYNETNSHRLYIENSSSSTPLIYGNFDADSIIINGDFNVTGNAGGGSPWTNTSDRRAKKEIKTILSPIAKIQQLRGVTYQWKDGRETGNQLGFIAQETNEVLPEVVRYNKKEDEYSMQYAPITAVLVEAVKEQQTQINELKKENEALKTQIQKINELEAMLKALQAQY